MPVADYLETMFRADAEAAAAQDRFFADGSDPERVGALRAAIEAAADAPPTAARTRLMRVADLCAQVPGPDMADTLVELADHADILVRDAAGRALVEAGFERYAEIARAIDRALDAERRGPAMEILPLVVAEIGEPSAVGILRRFLAHPDADVVASAIEGFAELGDPDGIPYVEELVDDDRKVSLDDTEETTTSLGELAEQTIMELGFDPDDEDG